MPKITKHTSLSLVVLLWVIFISLPSNAQTSSVLQIIEKINKQLDIKPEESLISCDSLLNLEGLTDTEKTHIYFTISDIYYYLADIRASYEAAKQGFAILPSDFPTEKKILFLNSQGQNLDYLGEADSAIAIYKEGLLLAREIKDSLELSNLYFNIALSHNTQLHYQQALNYFDSSYYIDYILEDSFRLSHVLRAIGYMEDLYFEYQEGEKNYREALKFVTNEDQTQKCMIYVSLGTNFYKQNIRDSVEKYISLASQCFEQSNDKISHHYLYLLKGKYFLKVRDSLRANAALDTAISIAKKTGDRKEEIMAKLLKLELSEKLVDEENFTELLNFAEEHKWYKKLVDGYEIYIKKLVFEKKYKKALEIKLKADKYLKQYNSQTSQRLIQTQSAKFELLNKESEIKLANEKLKTQQAKWINYGVIGLGLFMVITVWFQYKNKKAGFLLKQEKLEKEKDLLRQIADVESQAFRAQMNPHFIFNALNSIKGFIINKQEKEAALFISKFSKLIRMVLDNSRKKVIPLASEIETLEIYLKLEQQRFRDGYTYQIKVDNSLEIENILLPPVIIQPFVENSIWHGFKNNTRENHLLIDIKEEFDFLLITITDNGVGRELSKKRHSSSKRKSHGIDITAQRLAVFSGFKNQALISYTDQLDKNKQTIGTIVTLKFPIKHQ